MADFVPEADAEVVARLRAAGAVVVGKTNLPEEVTGQETANALFGRSCNPWDPDRTPGGSSGGGAAAVAAGLSALEVGSDSGGSIRGPAHCCGVYGHFPTSGLVPLAGHLPSVPVEDAGADVDLMAAGPLARNADDLTLAMRVLAGVAPLAEPPAPERLRVAVWLGPSDMPPSQDVASLVRTAGDALASADASVREAAPAFDAAEARDVAFQLWVAARASSGTSPNGGGQSRCSQVTPSAPGWGSGQHPMTRCARRPPRRPRPGCGPDSGWSRTGVW